jgi:phytoene/squalene synthetase
VHVLLWEGEVEAAWRAAHDGGCAEGLWPVLARCRAEQHPADAIPVLRRHVDEVIASGKRDAYERAADLITELGTYHDRLRLATVLRRAGPQRR